MDSFDGVQKGESESVAKLAEINRILYLLSTVSREKWPADVPKLLERRATLEREIGISQDRVRLELRCSQNERMVVVADTSLRPSDLKFVIEWDGLDSTPYASRFDLLLGLNVATDIRVAPLTIEESGLETDGWDESETFAGRSDESLRAAIGRNTRTPGEALRLLAKDNNPKDSPSVVRMAVASNINTPEDVLGELSKDGDSGVRQSVARNPSTPVEVIEALANDESPAVRGEVMRNPNATLELCEQLALDDHDDVRRAVGLYSRGLTKALENLMIDPAQKVRVSVAANPGATVNILTLLAEDQATDVRQEVARNPNTPERLLAKLATDSASIVRQMVAGNPNSPAEVLSSLARGTDGRARERVAANPTTSPEILRDLLHLALRNMDGADLKPENPSLPVNDFTKTQLMYSVRGVRTELAKNPNSPPDVLYSLKDDDHSPVLWKLGSNPNSPRELLNALGTNQSSDVRSGVAGNPNIPPEVLRVLLEDKVSGVRKALAQNPNVPDEAFAALARDADESVRAAVATNPGTPLDILRNLELSGAVREALVRNPHTPSDVINKLASDENVLFLEKVVGHPNVPEETILAIFAASQTKGKGAEDYSRAVLIDVIFSTTLEVAVGSDTRAVDFWESIETWPAFDGDNFYIVDREEHQAYAEILVDGVKVWDTMAGSA